MSSGALPSNSTPVAPAMAVSGCCGPGSLIVSAMPPTREPIGKVPYRMA
ncbi:hypothetical protein WJ969_12095 [Achromobacter xylosoxidans]